MMGFTSIVEPLRSANYLSNQELYEWWFYTPDNHSIAATNGISITPTRKLDEYQHLNFLFVCSGIGASSYNNPLIYRWLNRISTEGINIGAVTTGAYLLARAGLLDHCRCTIHWESLPSFSEEFPQIQVTRGLYEIDHKKYTCSGGTAALDLMLHLIADSHGKQLALDVAAQFQHDRVRNSTDKQGNAHNTIISFQSPKLATAISLMNENLESPNAPAKIANAIGLSLRQLERLFHKYCHCTPQRYYLRLRLEHARRLLLETNMSILNASIATGFASQSHFTKCYRDHYGYTPKQERSRSFATLEISKKS